MGRNIRKKLTIKRVDAAKNKKPTPTPKDNPLNAKVAKTAKGKRMLKKREAKAIEDAKNTLIMKGHNIKGDVTTLLKELHDLKKPFSKSYMRKHDIKPFESHEKLKSLCVKEDCSLFAIGSSTKKRPFNLTMGRLFNNDLLDMQEFDVTNFVSMSSFKGIEMPVLGSKPMLVFQGAPFDGKLAPTKSLLMDFFRGAAPEKVALQHLEHCIIFTAEGEEEDCVIRFRQYKCNFSKSSNNSKLPFVNMKEMGPRFDIQLNRDIPSDPNIMKLAMRQPKEILGKKTKNIETTILGQTKGRLHLGRQEFDKIFTPHQGFEDQHNRKRNRDEKIQTDIREKKITKIENELKREQE